MVRQVRDDFGPDSDVDVLVEFAPDHTPGWEIVDIEEDLSTLFGGRKVDVVNPKVPQPEVKGSGAGRGGGALCRRMTPYISVRTSFDRLGA